jgi:hypothetical protein
MANGKDELEPNEFDGDWDIIDLNACCMAYLCNRFTNKWKKWVSQSNIAIFKDATETVKKATTT